MSRYTPTQTSTIEYLISRGKAIHKQMTDATNEYDRERLQNDLDYIKSELNDAINAEARMKAHIRLAKEHLDEAEAIHAKWCKA